MVDPFRGVSNSEAGMAEGADSYVLQDYGNFLHNLTYTLTAASQFQTSCPSAL